MVISENKYEVSSGCADTTSGTVTSFCTIAKEFTTLIEDRRAYEFSVNRLSKN